MANIGEDHELLARVAALRPRAHESGSEPVTLATIGEPWVTDDWAVLEFVPDEGTVRIRNRTVMGVMFSDHRDDAHAVGIFKRMQRERASGRGGGAR